MTDEYEGLDDNDEFDQHAANTRELAKAVQGPGYRCTDSKLVMGEENGDKVWRITLTYTRPLILPQDPNFAE